MNFCQRSKLLFSLFMFTSERMINSRIDLKRRKSLNWTEERFFSKTTLFICILFLKRTNTHTHIYTFRVFFLNEKEKTTHEIDLKRKVRIIRLSKTRNIVFNIDSSFKKWSSQTIILQTLKTENQKSSSWRRFHQ